MNNRDTTNQAFVSVKTKNSRQQNGNRVSKLLSPAKSQRNRRQSSITKQSSKAPTSEDLSKDEEKSEENEMDDRVRRTLHAIKRMKSIKKGRPIIEMGDVSDEVEEE